MKEWSREIRSLPKRRRIRHLLHRLIHEYDSPQRLSLAIAMGVFVGTLPFFGLHMWIGLLLAFLVGLNKLAVLLGTQISIPWVAPVLIWSSLQIGEWVLHHRFLKIDPSHLQLDDLLPAWLLGSIILGTFLGLLSYGLSLTLVLRWRRLRRQPHPVPNAQKDVGMK
jgi:uncharacterized protein (DUF2062 family)